MPQENENSFFTRAVKCLSLNSDAYEEVEHDESATKQALILVLISGTAFGLYQSYLYFEEYSPMLVLVSVIFGMLKWALFAWIAYFVGTRIFRTEETEADWGQLARTLGFANTPSILFFGVFFFSLETMETITLIAVIWLAITSFIAIRQALELTNMRALGATLVSNSLINLFLGIFFRFL
ncbi:MAG: hypothetical protein CL872_00580 [Dehalococcoidaceae bacterium]|nr:hypothetical protein [Dehalococcoidaceae bacterium]|tara:strand:- start:12815 stop:13357 length:543 start_codon:yes stop_codon:yes gene_type:complete